VAGRGIAPEAAESFLSPTLRELLPDPSRFLDMDKAADRLARAVQAGESIAVFGDYDVDGATSSALLARFFAAAGRPIRVYIPDRMKEGYGPNLPALLALQAEGVRLVITVDCGITAFEPLAPRRPRGSRSSWSTITWPSPACPPPSRWSIPTGSTRPRGHGQLAAVGSPSCWPWPSTGPCAGPAGMARSGWSPI
jgi:Single-stranded DNA-specific exonuclease